MAFHPMNFTFSNSPTSQSHHDREQIEQQAIDEAIAHLSAILHPQQTPTTLASDPLLIAVGAIGRVLGIEIRSPDGCEAWQRDKDPLDAIAHASRMRVRRIHLNENWWKHACEPFLTYTRCHSTPVALLPKGTSGYEIFNPLDGSYTLIQSALADLQSEAYQFYRPFPDRVMGAWQLVQFAIHRQFSDWLTITCTGIGMSLLGLLIPFATAIVIDYAIPSGDRAMLWVIALGLLAVALGIASFRFVQGIALLRVSSLTDVATQAAFWDRLLQVQVSFFRTYSVGDLEKRLSAVSEIHRLLRGTVLNTWLSGLFSLLNLALLIYYSQAFAWVAIVIALVAAIATGVAGAIALHHLQKLEAWKGKIRGVTIQLIGSVAKLRVAAAEGRAFAYWSRLYRQQQSLVMRTEAIDHALDIVNAVLPSLSSIVLFGFASAAIQSSTQFSTGTFLAFNAAFGSFVAGVTSLSQSGIQILQMAVLWEQAQPILKAPQEVEAHQASPGKLSGQVKLDQVTFHYDRETPILEQISIQAEAGEFIAIVGHSGSGKSTLLRLLLGFEQPTSGAIYYDEQDLSGLDVNAVRRQLGVVLQDSQVLSASIFENIAGGALITLEEAAWAAQCAGLTEDIAAMPMGMHTLVSEGGTNLSGGQRQRLLLARAVALRPKILLLDEATSALDNATQSLVTQNIHALRVTRIVVAHRLSTIRDADRIYVLDKGRIVQQGTFAELIQTGLFARLMARQY
jgi:ATP-binding cassette subfamily C protein